MPIQIRSTPNPNALKFVLPTVRFAAARNYASLESAAGEPLAARLLALDGVYNVFVAQDFVTVNKRPETSWEPLQSQILALIEAHLAASAIL